MGQNDRLEVSREALERLPLILWETDLEGRLLGTASGGDAAHGDPGDQGLTRTLEADGRLRGVLQDVARGATIAFEQRERSCRVLASMPPPQ